MTTLLAVFCIAAITVHTLAIWLWTPSSASPPLFQYFAMGDSTLHSPTNGKHFDTYAHHVTKAILHTIDTRVGTGYFGGDGSTCAMALAHLNAEPVKAGPDLVTLMFGIDDNCLASAFEDNLRTLVDTLKKRGSGVVLLTPPRLRQCAIVARFVGAEMRVPVVDVFGMWTQAHLRGVNTSEWLMDDRHFSALGHKMVGDALAPVVIAIAHARTK